ncbi:MAG: MOSC domain-containing protein [Acidobacteria bacterium]|nr:MOSC domain-containing protein [Acidobacteriota bacterium]
MTDAVIKHVCASKKRGTVKRAVESARIIAGHGLEGDAHAGAWHRQVSLLAEADIDGMRAEGLDLAPGAFGENLVTEGLDLDSLGIGSRVVAGEVELEITQIGKVCHTRCAIYERTGDCIMPRAGIFARALTSGEVRPGTPLEVGRRVPRETIQAAVLTVSDSCSAGTATDTAGPAVVAILQQKLGANIGFAGIEPDDRARLEAMLMDLTGRGLDLVFTAGGTGMGPRDVTPEATRAVIEREAPGLAEAMRAASARVTPHALLQRGVCGILRSTLVVNLPGSRKAAVENLETILPALEHAVKLLRGGAAHPGDERRPRAGGVCLPLAASAAGRR